MQGLYWKVHVFWMIWGHRKSPYQQSPTSNKWIQGDCVPYQFTSSTRTRRGGSCLKDIYIYIRPFSSIELACAVRQPSPWVRAICDSGVLFHMSHLKLHFALHTALFTLQTSHFTLHSSHSTLHTSQSTLHTSQSTLHTSQSTLHTSHCFLHTPHFTLHSWRPALHIVSRPALAREPPGASNPHWFVRWTQILPGLI